MRCISLLKRRRPPSCSQTSARSSRDLPECGGRRTANNSFAWKLSHTLTKHLANCLWLGIGRWMRPVSSIPSKVRSSTKCPPPRTPKICLLRPRMSPYFGDSLQGLDLLTERFATARLNLFPAVHSGNATNIPLDQLQKSHKSARVSQLAVSSKKGAFAHPKLYGVASEDESAWLYCTSANCTQAAGQGPNIEAGLLRVVSPSLLTNYFSPGNTELPPSRLQIEYKHEAADALHCWATDTGAGLDLQIANDERQRLPLRDARWKTLSTTGHNARRPPACNWREHSNS